MKSNMKKKFSLKLNKTSKLSEEIKVGKIVKSDSTEK